MVAEARQFVAAFSGSRRRAAAVDRDARYRWRLSTMTCARSIPVASRWCMTRARSSRPVAGGRSP